MATGDFRWNKWNRAKVAKHGVTPEEAQQVIRCAKRHEHRRHKRGTWLVYGRGNSNRKLQVIYMKDPDGTYFVIHAMPR
jgi:uncharacterized DUF497 family protein